MLSNQQIKNNWPSIKSQVLSHWNKLSESEVEETHGRMKSLLKLVREKYGNNNNFEKKFKHICDRYTSLKLGKSHAEMDMAEKSMDKDRDDQYLAGPYGVTRPIDFEPIEMDKIRNNILGKELFNEFSVDGFNNEDRHSTDYSGLNSKIEIDNTNIEQFASDEIQKYQVPRSKKQEITLGRSNSSANTTSHSALPSSEAKSKDTKKL